VTDHDCCCGNPDCTDFEDRMAAAGILLDEITTVITTTPLNKQSPKGWFDQFTPEDLANIKGNAQWCARHWAPCPIFGANGIGASIEMASVFMNEWTTARTPEQINADMHNAGKICCTLGDDRMYEIWGHWPPAAAHTEN